MPAFNVLDRKQDLQGHSLLEASAGTGKTFSIEHIVVRLLLEDKEPLQLEQILVVTFTRAATRDLKMRIRTNLECALSVLQGKADGTPADYLVALLEQGSDVQARACRRLEQALFGFDQASIFTIHSFCARTLRDNLFEGDIALGMAMNEETTEDDALRQVIRDFLRTELTPELFSAGQLTLLLNEYGSDKLENELLQLLKKNLEIELLPSYADLLTRFQLQMRTLSPQFQSDKILDDFILLAPCYKDLCDKNHTIKAASLAIVKRFAALFGKECWSAPDFDQLLMDGLFLVEALAEEQRSKRAKLPPVEALHYPTLISLLQQLVPLVEEARNPHLILCRIARGCAQLLQLRLEAEEQQVGCDQVLHAMAQALQQSSFVARVRNHYKVALIDEFQDTDPLQWKIFETLFLQNWEGRLYLVGDPKQSIYAFRRADIYTYLQAARALGPDRHASLDTNYRSTPDLVKALNALFCPEHTPGFIQLPRLDTHLTYHPVKTAFHRDEKPFSDHLGSVHFCLAEAKSAARGKGLPLEQLETEQFFPFIAAEIGRLHRQEGLLLNQLAVLVANSFQAQRLVAFLGRRQIRSSWQRPTNLLESAALLALRDLLYGVLHPHQQSALKIALGGAILGWGHHDVLKLEDATLLEKVLLQFHHWRGIWREKGFGAFFDALLQSHGVDNRSSIEERLLMQQEGLAFYDDLQQLAHLLLEEESQQQAAPEELIALLDRLATEESSEDPRLSRYPAAGEEAVQVLTIHSSKGLEFDVVFTLGLITRSPAPKPVLPLMQGDKPPQLIACKTDSPAYRRHCEELDAEKMRQLYVAMTRAKRRVYVPAVFFPSQLSPKMGCASPMELFLARQTLMQEPLYDCLAQGYDGTSLRHLIDRLSPTTRISYCHLTQQDGVGALVVKTPPILHPSPTLMIANHPLALHSFTSLARNRSESTLPENSATPPHDAQAPLKTVHTLPAGSMTGRLLHRILETIPFENVRTADRSSQLFPFVNTALQGSSLSNWAAVVSELIFNALRTPLPTTDGPLHLCDCTLQQRTHEMEFLFPSEGLLEIEELHRLPGFVKGYIDLVVQHREKYYIVDWKSEWLGPDEESYTQSHLAKAMEQHQYPLQAAVYRAALERYLRIVDPRPFNQIFGGTFYIFLRGCKAAQRGCEKIETGLIF